MIINLQVALSLQMTFPPTPLPRSQLVLFMSRVCYVFKQIAFVAQVSHMKHDPPQHADVRPDQLGAKHHAHCRCRLCLAKTPNSAAVLAPSTDSPISRHHSAQPHFLHKPSYTSMSFCTIAAIFVFNLHRMHFKGSKNYSKKMKHTETQKYKK